MNISEVIRRKGDAVVTVKPAATVAELLALLAEHNIGAVVVSDDDGATLAGIVSERDIVRRLNTTGAVGLELTVAQVMTSDVHTCSPQDELSALARRMTDLRIRHLPVVADGRLAAIVSIGDIVKIRLDQLQEERDQLADYVQQ